MAIRAIPPAPLHVLQTPSAELGSLTSEQPPESQLAGDTDTSSTRKAPVVDGAPYHLECEINSSEQDRVGSKLQRGKD